MNVTLNLWLAIVLLLVNGSLASGITLYLYKRRQFREQIDFAERADSNGRRLCEIARGLRQMPGIEGAWQITLHKWADDLDHAAVAHLQCINAIGLEAMEAVGGKGNYLGEFKPSVAGRNAKPTFPRPVPPANPPHANPHLTVRQYAAVAASRGKAMSIAERIASALFQRLFDRFVAAHGADFIVGADNPDGAYLHRWFLTPWRRWQSQVRDYAKTNPTSYYNRARVRMANMLPNLYLHCFLRDDDDQALHDHPSWAVSFMLHGSYVEHTIAAGGIHQRRQYNAGSLRFLRAGGPKERGNAHRIELLRYLGDPPKACKPCWTLFLFGPAKREWGFHCPQRGWVPWREFTADGQPGEVGRGCE